MRKEIELKQDVETSPISVIAMYEDYALKPKDQVGNSTLREGLRYLPDALTREVTPRRSYRISEKIVQQEQGKEFNPQRRSYQWTASMFHGATEKLYDLNVEPYDEFQVLNDDPKTQLQIIDVFKRTAAGVIANWAFNETRQVSGERRVITKETAQQAIETFAQLETVEQEIIDKEDLKLEKQQVASKLQSLPLTAGTALVAASLALGACGPMSTPSTETDNSQNHPQVTLVVEAPTESAVEGPTIKPTQEAHVPTQTSIPTPERPSFEAAGGSYTKEQIESIQNATFEKQEQQLTNWVRNYWGLAENRPFHPDSLELHYYYLFDENNPEKALVLLQAESEEYQGKVFGLPVRDGQFITTPPEVVDDSFSIPEGFGPLELSITDNGNQLVLVDGKISRVNREGKVVQRVNEQGQWEEVKAKEKAFLKEKGVFLNPEYDLHGQLEMIRENAPEFYSYLIRGFSTLIPNYWDNPEGLEYISKALGKDIENRQDFEELMKSGKLIPPLENGRGCRTVWHTESEVAGSAAFYLDKPCRFDVIEIMVMDEEQYKKVTDTANETGFINEKYMLSPYHGLPEGYAFRVGLIPILENDPELGEYYRFAILIANFDNSVRVPGITEDMADLGGEEETELDILARLTAAYLRAAHPGEDPPLSFVPFEGWGLYEGVRGGVGSSGIARVFWTDRVLDNFRKSIENNAEDIPPEIIRLSSNGS